MVQKGSKFIDEEIRSFLSRLGGIVHLSHGF